MSFKLLPSQFENGLQTETQFLLTALYWINDTTLFPNPFTVAAVKTKLELGQPSTFTDANFRDYLTNIYNLIQGLDTTLLTTSELTRFNIIWEYLTLSPFAACNGVDTPTALLTTMNAVPRIGSATFERELQVLFDKTVSGAAASVQVTIVGTGGAPAALVSPVTLTPWGCFNDKWVFKKLWIDFGSDPSTKTYDFDLVVKDINGTTIAAYSKTGFVMP